MLYAITFTLGGFERTDTIIVELNKTQDESYIFGDNLDDLKQALLDGTGLDETEVDEVIKDKSYYLKNVADIDTHLEV